MCMYLLLLMLVCFSCQQLAKNWGICSLFQLVGINDRKFYCEVACESFVSTSIGYWKGIRRGLFLVCSLQFSLATPSHNPLKGSPAALQQPQLLFLVSCCFPPTWSHLPPLGSEAPWVSGLHCSHSQALHVPACLCVHTHGEREGG